MNLCPASVVLLFLGCLVTFIAAADDPNQSNLEVSINCGSSAILAARNGRKWRGDVQKNFSPLVQIKGSSTSSNVIHKLASADDPVPYKTARISRSQFSYAFRVNPGTIMIRLHFNSGPYKGFKRLKDLFTVEAGSFTLLGNFSASLTAVALNLKSFSKEFFINVEDNEQFTLAFIPESSQSLDTYAFVNGIEIISVAAGPSYFDGGDVGVQVVGRSPVLVNSNTALETIHRLNVKVDSVLSAKDIGGMSGLWETVPNRKGNKISNVTWKISVDVGFRYLVRLHFSEIGFKMAEIGGFVFQVRINDVIADANIGMVSERDDVSIPCYTDHMVIMTGSKQEGKRDLLIFLQSDDEFMDGHGPLKGFEVLKLSNHDNSLASLNPLPLAQDSSHQTIQHLVRVLGNRNVIATVAIAVVAAVNIIVYISQLIWEVWNTDEENMPSIRAERLCRRFSLAEMQSATGDFSYTNLIGKGGFGTVYKGLIKGGETVAIKRLKSGSSQGAHEFLTEIATLTELRHVNLVSLIGYCKERGEMILVYEYMASGTLADHLFKHGRNGDNSSALTWKQRLNICIGAGRGLEYLHTGHSLIHRDVKASNILLDENFVPKVADFGLAKPLSTNKLQSHISTKVKGTFGYLDPKYVYSGKLTRESDTYSFGVVLLEVLSGRRAIGSLLAKDDERILTRWAQENISKGNADQIVDSNLRDEISQDSLKIFLEIAVRCLHDGPMKRPTMAEVVVQLQFALKMQESPKSPAPNVVSQENDVHLLNSEIKPSVSSEGPALASKDVENFTSLTEEQTNGKVVDAKPASTKNGGRKRTSLKPSRLWPWYGVRGRGGASRRGLVIFSQMIKKADLDFLKEEDQLASLEVIGKGGCGEVYKAVLPGSNGKEIAIKKIIQPPRDAEELTEEDSRFFTKKVRQIESEIQTFGHIRHRNVLPLLAYLPGSDYHYLVYEYMKNGSLQDCLKHVREGKRELDWLARHKIALGVAAGLEHLHIGHSPRIIHRDLKPGNVLLNDEMEPRITDFGLAKAVPDVYTHVSSSNVAGTVGYIAPECYQTFKFTDKCDIYSFGVLLGTLVIGKLPTDEFFRHTDEMSFLKWMRNVMNSEDPKRAIDATLLGNGYEEQMLLALKVACFCTLDDPRERPNSKDVRSMLAQIALVVPK